MKTFGALLLSTALLAAGCGSGNAPVATGGTASSGGSSGGKPSAAAAFWEAFNAQQYDALPRVIEALGAAYQKDPKDPENTLLYAHAHLWKLAEWGRDPGQDKAQIPGVAMAADQHFAEAHALNPDDARIFGWLGPVEISMGKALKDSARVAKGEALIDEGAQKYPEFNLFVRGLINSRYPRTDPAFGAGVEAMWQTLDACVGEKVDRQNLDYAKYLPQATRSGPKRVCWNDAEAAHNFEGFFFYMGDMLVKKGDVPAATMVYKNAQVSPDYARWPFKAALEQRLAQAEARAALYADADPTNDPPLVGDTPTACATCHATK